MALRRAGSLTSDDAMLGTVAEGSPGGSRWSGMQEVSWLTPTLSNVAIGARQTREAAPDGRAEAVDGCSLARAAASHLRGDQTIAVVGASGEPSKPAHQIPRYLQRQGYRILPVNPHGGQVLGEPVARSLAEVEGSVDVVEVFRPATEAPELAREAVKTGAQVLWLQLGIVSEEARQVPRRLGSRPRVRAAARPALGARTRSRPTSPGGGPDCPAAPPRQPESAARSSTPGSNGPSRAAAPAMAAG
jgi:predicted CoA-binding protein